jgi:hypothetical protein
VRQLFSNYLLPEFVYVAWNEKRQAGHKERTLLVFDKHCTVIIGFRYFWC